MQIIVKESEHKIDPKHPQSTDPSFAFAESAGRKRVAAGGLKFKSKGDESDYNRAVGSNPANIYGLPPFHPGLKIRTSVTMPEVTDEDRQATYEQRLREIQRVVIVLGCNVCTGNTPHVVSPWESFCQVCGTQKLYRTN